MSEFLSYYINVGNSIDSLWNIFMGLHLVLFASLLKYGKIMSRLEKLTFLAAYLIFFLMNCRAIIANYQLLEGFRRSFLSSVGAELSSKYNDMIQIMNNGSLAYRIETAIFIHIFGLLIIMYLLFSRGKLVILRNKLRDAK